MKAKMAIKDVGRVLSVPLAKVNEIAKLVPEDLNITLEKALEKDQELSQLYEIDEEVTRLIDLAKKIRGIHSQYRYPCGRNHHQWSSFNRSHSYL